MDAVELLIKIRTEGEAALNKIVEAMRGVESRAKATETAVVGLDSAQTKLDATTKAVSNSYSAAAVANTQYVNSIAGVTSGTTAALAVMQKAADAARVAGNGNVQYSSSVVGITSSTSGLTAVVQKAAAVTKAASTETQNLSNQTQAATEKQSMLTESMSMSVLKGFLLAEVLGTLAGSLKAASVDAALYASRTQQMNVVMEQLARTNNLSVPAVRQQADAVKALGITTQESRNTITQMIFAQLDLAKATDLARLAQNAAKVAGISSSDALNGILNGIKTQQIEVLRTYGIQVSFEQALTRGAAKLGKTRETLTDYERANIALNEVLSKGPRILGAYEVSLTTTAGQMQSLSRLTDEAKNALGEQFAPTLQRTIEFLSRVARGVQENAESVANFTTVLTAASLAAAAFRFTPGPPAVKGGVAAAVGLGALFLGNEDPEVAALDAAKEAIRKIETDKRAVLANVQKGLIKDKAEYQVEIDRLGKLETIVEQQLTDALAKIYAERRRIQEQQAKDGTGAGTEPGLSLPKIEPIKIPDFDLGSNRQLLSQRIEAAIKDIGKKTVIDPAGLKFTPDPKAEIDAQFAAFTAKIKEAQKSASDSVKRVQASALTGESRLLVERANALSKVAENFAPFDKSLRSGAEYQRLIGTINTEYRLLIEQERRLVQVDALKNTKRLEDTKAQISVDQLRQRTLQSQEVASVTAESNDPQLNINRVLKERLLLAKQEYEASKASADAALKSAQAIYKINSDAKALTEAENTDKLSTLKLEAQYTKDKSQAEHDAQIAILKLRKEQRKELQQTLDNAQRLIETEQTLILSRTKDSASRAVRLVQAQTKPGDERFAQEFQLKTRVDIARQEYDMTKETLEAQKKQALDSYIRTKDKVELERRNVEFRQKELQAEYNLERELLDARLDREIQIADIRRQQTAELRQSLGSLYDAAKASGKNGLRDFFSTYTDQFKKTIFVNLGEEVFRGATQKLGGLIPGQEKVDPLTGKGTGELTTLGRILRGTPLGIDPAKLAADKQINAQDRNTKAVDRLTDTLGNAQTTASQGPASTSNPRSGLGGILGSILTGGGGALPGLIIRNAAGANPGGSQLLPTSSKLVFDKQTRATDTNTEALRQVTESLDKLNLQTLVSAPSPKGAGIGSVLAEVLSKTSGPTSSPSLINSLVGTAPSGGSSLDFRPDKGFGGLITKLQDKISPKDTTKFSAGKTALAAAVALPSIIDGVKEGGVKGTTSAAAGALGVAASIPGPQQPFVLGASILLGVISGFMKSKKQQKEEDLNARLSQKFNMPSAIELNQDLAGNAVDYDFRGRVRSAGVSNNVTVQVNTMDAKSFMQNSSMIAEAARAAIQLGHPLRDTMQEVAGGR